MKRTVASERMKKMAEYAAKNFPVNDGDTFYTNLTKGGRHSVN